MHSSMSPTSSSSMVVAPSQTTKQTATVEVEELVLPVKDLWIYKVDVDSLVRERQSDPVRALRLPARGLVNLGNTCFMNATLQCLAAGTHFMSTLQLAHRTASDPPSLGPHASQCTVHKNEFCVYCVVEGFIGRVMIDSAEKRAVVPRALAINIRALGRQFRPGRQEDSHEFLRCLLYRMVLSSLKAHGVKEGSKDRRDETTALHSVFGGYLRNQVHCTSCGFDSNTYDCFLDLSLEVGNGITSVDKALQHFTAKEKLDKNNMWKCPRENKNVCAEKQLTIRSTPSALTIHLKRFSYVPMSKGGSSLYSMLQQLSGGGGQKLNSHIKFTDSLDITAALSDAALREKQSSLYNLYGVLVHSGYSSNSGHYFSFVKSLLTGRWYMMNDETVQPVTWEQVEKQQAYILFYSKQEPASARQQRSSLPTMTPEDEKRSMMKISKTMIDESERVRASSSSSSSSSSSKPSVSIEAAGSVPRTIDVLGDVVWAPKDAKVLSSSSSSKKEPISRIVPQYDGAPLSEQVYGLPQDSLLSTSESSLAASLSESSMKKKTGPEVDEEPETDWASRSKKLRLISVGKAKARRQRSSFGLGVGKSLDPRWRWDLKRIVRDSRSVAVDGVDGDNEEEKEEEEDEKTKANSVAFARIEKKRKATADLANEGHEGEFAVRTSALHNAAVLAAGGLYDEDIDEDEDEDEDGAEPDTDKNSSMDVMEDDDDDKGDAEPELVSFSDAMRQAMESVRGPLDAEAARRAKIAEEKRVKKEKAKEKDAKAKEREAKIAATNLLKKAARQQQSDQAKAAAKAIKSKAATAQTSLPVSAPSEAEATMKQLPPTISESIPHVPVGSFKSTKKAPQLTAPPVKFKSPLESVEISGQRRASFSPKEFAARAASTVIDVGTWEDDETSPAAGEGRGGEWAVQLTDTTSTLLAGKRERDSSSVARSNISELDEEFDRGRVKKVKKANDLLRHPGAAAFQAVHEEIKRRGK